VEVSLTDRSHVLRLACRPLHAEIQGDGEEFQDTDEPCCRMFRAPLLRQVPGEDRVLESLNDKTKIESLVDRYQTTKLLETLFVRDFFSHIAGSSTEPVNPIVNLPNWGLNDNAVRQGKPDTHISIALFNLFLRTFTRLVEKGARTLVTAAAAGEGSHGSYLSDQVVTEPAPFIGSDQGAKVWRKLFAEVMDVLEKYVPGCRSVLQGDEIGG
jgi:hypothetical protein